MSSNNGQRDPELGHISSNASEADEECTDTEPVRTTSAGPMPFTNYGPMLRSVMRSASEAVTRVARANLGPRVRTASRDRGVANAAVGNYAVRANGHPGPGRNLTPRRRPRSGDEEEQANSGTPSRRRIRSSKSPILPARPVARALPNFQPRDRQRLLTEVWLMIRVRRLLPIM